LLLKKNIFYKDNTGKLVNKNALHLVKREIAILKKLSHPNIIRLFEVIQNEEHDKIYLI
jgi:serine/threonine protein kinase